MTITGFGPFPKQRRQAIFDHTASYARLEELNRPNKGNRASKEAKLLNRFKDLQDSNREGFFDVEEFSTIIAHYLERFELDRANHALRQGLSQHPGSLELTINKAYLKLCAGKPKETIKILGEMELLHPFNQDILSLKAEAYGQMGKANKGIKILEQILGLASVHDRERVLVQLAELFMLESMYLDAIVVWKEVLKIDAKREVALVALLHCFKEVDLVEEGIRVFTEMTEAEPFNGLTWVQLGECYASLDRYAEAVQAYEYALAIDESNLIALYNMADSLYQIDRYPESLETFRILNKLTPQEPQILCGIGENLEQLDEHNKALEAFKAAVAIDARDTQGRLGVAICLELLGDNTKAIIEMETVVALSPDNAEYWFIYAELLSRSYKLEKGQHAYERAISLADEEPEYILGQIDALLNQDEYSRALDKVQDAFEILGDQSDVYFRGIKALHRLGQHDESMTLLSMLIDRHGEYQGLEKFYPEILLESDAKQLLSAD